ncbi:hypothetical protein ANCDUO_01420 [Ancylostoma duodenale]|uniref:Tyrosinase copper-binding domain-containing protein n=1 Tax=Ancylostoma duodenale TaxID=51022 RepID=A0A0C2HF86_9BILA|nr:hypothetical protein ANCDUO_01420 [Ancylostoma duodenale]
MLCNKFTAWDKKARELWPNIPKPGPSSYEKTVYDCTDLRCLCGYLNGTYDTSCVLPNGNILARAVRREYRMLSEQQRERYHNAMNVIKKNGVYDDLARLYTKCETSPGAHAGPAFLPWHRVYLTRLEIALRVVDPTVSLPYWDTTLEFALHHPNDSILWTKELMGKEDNDGYVYESPFMNWKTLDGRSTFMRRVGRKGQLIRESDIAVILNSSLEEQMLAYTAATMNEAERQTQYPNDDKRCSGEEHFAHSPMIPFTGLQNIDGLSNKYTDNLYVYSERPKCSEERPEGCNSKYLFCDFSNGEPHCASKIRIGGFCGGYTKGEKPCYQGVCNERKFCVKEFDE